MTYSEFKKIIGISKKEIYRRILETNRDVFRIKKEEKVIENLMKIFDATLEISNKKGFRAMSIRDLSGKSGLSTGALYSYFSSKDELLHLIQMQGREIANKVLRDQLAEVKGARKKMQRAIQAHLHLSEIMQPWFYFTYIEARNLCADEQRRALESELYTEKIFMDILEEGIKEKVFRADNVILTAAIIKAMLQDWYLKRWKYRKRKVSVDDYKKFIIEVIEAYIIPGNSGT
ncbi:MAG TPA: TetR/AcrR family transcriptional regulator [Smithellaceae bacterium]|nr:TetR/AcrR family transcriptional regulator [Smithellaceae bacterium]